MRVLAQSHPGRIVLVEADEDAQAIGADYGDDGAAPGRSDQSARVEPAGGDGSLYRRGDARLTQADGQAGNLGLGCRLGRLGRGHCRGGGLQFLLADHAGGANLLARS